LRGSLKRFGFGRRKQDMDKTERQAREKEMLNHVESWKASTLTQKQYCQQNGISLPTFYYWIKRIRYKESHQPGGFIPLLVNGGKRVTHEDCEIHYPNGVTIRVPSTADLQLVSRLVRLV